MFVKAGAKSKIRKRRQSKFFDNYVRKLLEEAKSIGITKEELVVMIEESK